MKATAEKRKRMKANEILIAGKKRKRVIQEEQESDSEERQSENEEPLPEKDMANEKIIELLIEIRHSTTPFRGVPVDYGSREFWTRLATVVNEEVPDSNFTPEGIWLRVKQMRSNFRRRAIPFADGINDVFGHCEGCGRVVQLPNIFMHSTPSGSGSHHSGGSSSGRGLSSGNHGLTGEMKAASEKINELRRKRLITPATTVKAFSWLVEVGGLGAQSLLDMEDGEIIDAFTRDC